MCIKSGKLKLIHVIIIALCLIAITLLTVFNKNVIISKIVCADNDSLVLFDSKVYGTSEVFDNYFYKQNEEKCVRLKELNEYLVVKTFGNNKTEYQKEYIIIYSNEVPELNVEYYIAKNVKLFNYSLPYHSVIDKIKTAFSIIYFVLYSSLTFIILFVIIKAYSNKHLRK